MASNYKGLIKIALWAAAGLAFLFIIWPKPPAPPLPPIAGLPSLPKASGEPEVNSAKARDIKPGELATRLFGAVYHAPAAQSAQTAAPFRTPAPMPLNTNIRFLGVAMVEGLRKIIFSDITNKVSFAISPGEKYAGWTCVSIGETEAILSREGIEYRVSLK